jgi:excisionase family DNA binding protein
MKLLTIEQSAERLGVGVRFIRRLIAERRIPIHKIGKHVRIADGDLDAFIAAGRIEPTDRRPGCRPDVRPDFGVDQESLTGEPQPENEDGDWTAEAS